eukprot:382402-Pelagomonas_calceolata.AAC.2
MPPWIQPQKERKKDCACQVRTLPQALHCSTHSPPRARSGDRCPGVCVRQGPHGLLRCGTRGGGAQSRPPCCWTLGWPLPQ